MAHYAFSSRYELGIDIEEHRPEVENVASAKCFFTPEERAALRRLSGRERERLFFNIWTRKEGYMKAYGTGLRPPPASLQMRIFPEEVISR